MRYHALLPGVIMATSLLLFRPDTLSADVVSSAIALNGNQLNIGSATGNDGFFFKPTRPLQVLSLGYYDAGGDGLNGWHSVGLYEYDLSTASYQSNPFSPLDPHPDDFIAYYNDDPAQGIEYYFPFETVTYPQAVLIAEAVIGPGVGSTFEGFQYVDIDAVTLRVGTTYSITGFHPGSAQADDPIAFGFSSESIFAAHEDIGFLGYRDSFAPELRPFTLFEYEATDFRYIAEGIEYIESYSVENFYRDSHSAWGPNFRYTAVPEPSSFATLIGFGCCAGFWRMRRRGSQR